MVRDEGALTAIIPGLPAPLRAPPDAPPARARRNRDGHRHPRNARGRLDHQGPRGKERPEDRAQPGADRNGRGQHRLRVLRRRPRLLVVRPLGGQLPERRPDPAVLDAQQRRRPCRPRLRHPGLQFHPGRRAGRPPDPRRLQDDQLAPDPDLVPLDPSDLVVFVVTLGSCLFLKLDTAIYVGIGVSLALFLQKTSTPTLVEYSINETRQPGRAARPDASAPTRRSRSSMSRASSSSAPPISSRSRSAAWPTTRTSGSSSCG